ncbi:BspA family leucine-rich repeat surface protein [Mycoplasma leachii]|uniref:Putative lipoprotein n=1 Tax=Mycoplasma leachii 06049 TaxID=1188244 RepID=A0A2T4I921_9MOLU|nr:BspA family leucine-rich repeat surface protein [Mycoplasma leachii]PTD31005.1 putative lipoprotein [Mycoplasma leachii 06049]
MKKLLTILGSVGLVATTSAAVIACGDKTLQKTPDTKPTEETKKEDKNNEENQKNESKPINTENDKKNSEVIKAIVKKQEDAFATFHTRKDFLDQIKVFAKEKGIENLELANKNENKTFKEGENIPENNVKLRLGTHEFEVQLGKVLMDRVATKYYIENDKGNIITDQYGQFSNLNNKVVITQIGYSSKPRDEYSNNGEKVIEIHKMPGNTIEVPEHLPLKIKSLKNAFKDFKLEKVLNLDKWDVSNVELMNEMFFGATNFDQDISNWNTENVKSMSGLFAGAENFNQSLNSWNVSKVTQMSYMFHEAKKFNQDLDKWNVSSVTDMESMFLSAESFNGKIDNWNVQNVNKLGEMFLSAVKFSQNLSKWKIKEDAFKNSSSIFDKTYVYKKEVSEAWGRNK